MLSVYRSNRLEALATRLAKVVRAAHERPLDSCCVAVPHLVMGRWLSLRIAASTGICTNLRFQFPATFIWELMRTALGEPATPYRYTQEALCWRLLGILSQLPQDVVYADLRGYLDAAGPGARYELAIHLAETYDRYLVYRPDWITDWEAGKGRHWQAHLWRRLVAGDGQHWVSTARHFQESLRTKQVVGAYLPKMACLFGIPTLSPSYLEVLRTLAELMELHLFLLDPCKEYWGDLESSAYIARAVMEDRPGVSLMQSGNSLLAGLGRQGRDFWDAVHGLEPGCEVELYESPGRTDRLHCLQSDLLELSSAGPVPTSVATDPSLQVHACHGPMRELEVLHDRLLDMFERWPDLKPSDIVVMAPDIERYAPLVGAIFDTAAVRIPYELTDRRLFIDEPVSLALYTLLALPESRFEVEAILELLALSPVRLRADIAEEELPRLRQWLEYAEVRWGVDQHHRIELQLPREDANTWRHGIDRLLLGCALPGELAQPFAGHVPCGDLEGEDVRLLGHLCCFLERLADLRERLGRQPSRSLEDWQQLLDQVIQEFLATPDSAADALATRIQSWFEIAAGTVPILHLADLRAGLHKLLATDAPGGRFPSTGVNFCRMVPMRSVPFAVVCLLGLDFDAYPRTFCPPSFDLSARKPRRGDRRQGDDDRHLFLEALLSARRCLYLSYAGHDARDDSERPPSVVVSELLANVGEHYGVAEDANGMPGGALIRHHPLQAFSKQYFDGSTPELYSYSTAALETCCSVSANLRLSSAFTSVHALADEALGQALSFADLESFCTGGGRFYLQRKLGVYAPLVEKYIAPEEPFVPLPWDLARLREILLKAELQAGPSPLTGFRVAGTLPHGDAGEAVLARERRTVQAFINSLDDEIKQLEIRDGVETFDLRLGALQLTVTLPKLSAAGAVYLYPRKPRESELMVLWVRHLALSLHLPPGVKPITHLSYLDDDNAAKYCRLQKVDNATAHLSAWLQYCRQGLAEPLPLLPKSSMVYANTLITRKQEPMQNAYTAWRGSPKVRGERDNFYNRLAFRGRPEPYTDERFAEMATTLLLPMQRALQ